MDALPPSLQGFADPLGLLSDDATRLLAADLGAVDDDTLILQVRAAHR